MKRRDFRYFAIFGMMRTGSNLLERLINQYSDLRCHGELFNPHFIGAAKQESFEGVTLAERERDPFALLSKLTASEGPIPGFRIFDGHDPRVEAHVLADPTCAKIVLRRSPIDSWVSLEIARKTDQWILGNIQSRRTAKVNFDAGAYARFLEDRQRYYSRIGRALQLHGQAAFEIRYEDLKDPDVLNGLAAYLGVQERKSRFAEPIKRQNPEPLSEKVLNYEEMRAALSGSAVEEVAASVAVSEVTSRDLILSATRPVLIAPVPGTARKPAMDWLREISGDGGIERNLNAGQFDAWLDRSAGLVSLAVVEHPLARAYRVFQRRIVGGNQVYPAVRERLRENFSIDVAEDAGKQATADGFMAFLGFLKANLAGQTGIRIDNEWAPQGEFLRGVCTLVPLSHIVRAEDFADLAQGLAARFGCSATRPSTASHGGGWPLPEIVTPDMQALCREVYACDYRALGYGDL